MSDPEFDNLYATVREAHEALEDALDRGPADKTVEAASDLLHAFLSANRARYNANLPRSLASGGGGETA